MYKPLDAASFGQFLAFAMPRIEQAIGEQVSSSNLNQGQQEYMGTAETFQQLHMDHHFDSLTKRMVDGEGKSQKAQEATKQSIEILLEQIACLRSIPSRPVKHQVGTQDFQEELSMTRRKLAQVKICLLTLNRRVDSVV